jgi:hypothetical protein
VAQSKYLGMTVTKRNWFRWKLRRDWIRVMLAIIQSKCF